MFSPICPSHCKHSNTSSVRPMAMWAREAWLSAVMEILISSPTLWCFSLPTHVEASPAFYQSTSFLHPLRSASEWLSTILLQWVPETTGLSFLRTWQQKVMPILVSMSFIIDLLIQVHVLLWAGQGAVSRRGWGGSDGNGEGKTILPSPLFVFSCLSGSLATSQFLIPTWLSSSFCRTQVWVFLDSCAKPGLTPISLPPKGLLKRINHFWSACYLWVFFWNLLCNFADFTWAKGASGISYLEASLPLFLYWNIANNLILSLSVHCFQVFCQRHMLL